MRVGQLYGYTTHSEYILNGILYAGPRTAAESGEPSASPSGAGCGSRGWTYASRHGVGELNVSLVPPPRAPSALQWRRDGLTVECRVSVTHIRHIIISNLISYAAQHGAALAVGVARVASAVGYFALIRLFRAHDSVTSCFMVTPAQGECSPANPQPAAACPPHRPGCSSPPPCR